jgi:hypothetical protein
VAASKYGVGSYGVSHYSGLGPTASKYGVGTYGVRHYSQGGAAGAIADLAGGAASTVRLTADLAVAVLNHSKYGLGSYGLDKYSQGVPIGLAGALVPAIVFTGDLEIPGQPFFAGELAPVIVFTGDLTFDTVIEGSLSFQVGFAADLYAGPLWAGSAPCPPPMWTPADPGVSPWAPAAPGDPVEWKESEPCKG